MSGLRIFKNGWTHLGCDAFLCNKNPTTWAVGVPDGPPGQNQQFCADDMAELIANLPDELLPALAVRLRKVSGSMIVHEELLEALTSGLETTAQFANLASAQERASAILAAVHGGTGADPDHAAQLASIEATVLQHVTEGTEWGQALVEKIAEALPDEEVFDTIAPTGPAPGVLKAISEAEAAGGGIVYVLPVPEGQIVSQDAILVPPGVKLRGLSAPVDIPTGAVNPEDVATHERLHGELLRAVEAGAPALTDGADTDPPNPDTQHACICGWDPKEGSTNPERDLKAHQRFCEAAKAQKGDG